MSDEGVASSTVTSILRSVDEIKFTDLPRTSATLKLVLSQRKTSKTLGRHFLHDVFVHDEPRLLVLLSHLYLEHVLVRYSERGGRQSGGGFQRQVRAAVEAGAFPDALATEIRCVARLRNAFAHELFYDFADWDPRESRLLGSRELRLPLARHLRRVKNVHLFKVLMLHIYIELHEAFDWLYLEDVPKSHRKLRGPSGDMNGRGHR